MKKYWLYCLLILAGACKNPAIPEEEISEDPIIRAGELNDSAIYLIEIDPEKNSDDALKVLEEAMTLDSNNAKTYYNALGILISQRRFDAGLKMTARLHRFFPDNAALIASEGMLQILTGDAMNGKENLHSAIGLLSADSLDKKSLLIKAFAFRALEDPRAESLRNQLDSSSSPTYNAVWQNRQQWLVECWKLIRPQ